MHLQNTSRNDVSISSVMTRLFQMGVLILQSYTNKMQMLQTDAVYLHHLINTKQLHPRKVQQEFSSTITYKQIKKLSTTTMKLNLLIVFLLGVSVSGKQASESRFLYD